MSRRPRSTYANRVHAGRMLARRLDHLRGLPDVLVLALPRGGVDVAVPVADYVGAPLDLLVVRKLGVPGQPELAAGAITGDGQLVTNPDVVRATGTTDEQLAEVAAAETRELARREAVYRAGRPPLEVAGKTVVLVDDGVATGATARAGLLALRSRGAARIVVAVPVGPGDVAELFPDADEVVCPSRPPYFTGVGAAYDDFAQLTDEHVQQVMKHC